MKGVGGHAHDSSDSAERTMRAVVQQRYGSPDALEVRDVAVPTIADDEVLVRVRAASVHPDVWHVVRGVPYVLRLMGAGLRHPTNTVPGTDVAGQVESIRCLERGDARGKIVITV